MASIRRIYLQGNDLHGTIPAEISGAQTLNYFLLTNNKLDGELPESI